jgi:transcriptional regulator with XRE-family HTH domain
MPYGKFHDISDRIREVRGNLKRSKFADTLGIPRTNLYKYESGRRPPADVLQKIADYGGVTVKWLLTGKSEDTEPDHPRPPERPRRAFQPGTPLEIQEFLFTEVLRAVEDYMEKNKVPYELEHRARIIVELYNHCARWLERPTEDLVLEIDTSIS